MGAKPKSGRGPIWGVPPSICEVDFFLVFLNPLSVNLVKELNCCIELLGSVNISLYY